MVLDPIILPFSRLCFAQRPTSPPLAFEAGESGKFETGRAAGNYDFARKHVEVIATCAVKD